MPSSRFFFSIFSTIPPLWPYSAKSSVSLEDNAGADEFSLPTKTTIFPNVLFPSAQGPLAFPPKPLGDDWRGQHTCPCPNTVSIASSNISTIAPVSIQRATSPDVSAISSSLLLACPTLKSPFPSISDLRLLSIPALQNPTSRLVLPYATACAVFSAAFRLRSFNPPGPSARSIISSATINPLLVAPSIESK